MILFNNIFFVVTVFLCFFSNLALFGMDGLAEALSAVLMYVGVFWFCVQYWSAKSMNGKKEIGFLWLFSLMVVLLPSCIIGGMSGAALEWPGPLVASIFTIFYLAVFFNSKSIFNYFFGLSERERWGSSYMRRFYFSRYPPRSWSDSFGVDVCMGIIMAIVIFSIL